MDGEKKEYPEAEEPGAEYAEEQKIEEKSGMKSSGRKKTIVLVVIVTLLLVGSGWFITSLFKSSSQTENKNETLSASPIPTLEPTLALIRSKWSFEVLNGSGVSGLAKKIADQLQDLGYPVIKVGNADRDDYTKSQIMVRSDLQDEINQVLVDLKDIIKIASVGGKLQDSTASARIIIGKD